MNEMTGFLHCVNKILVDLLIPNVCHPHVALEFYVVWKVNKTTYLRACQPDLHSPIRITAPLLRALDRRNGVDWTLMIYKLNDVIGFDISV